MQTTVKLYAYGYREVRTYLAASLFVLGNIVLPPVLPSLPAGRGDLASHLLLHAGRSLQIRLESGAAYRRAFPAGQFRAVRDASGHGASGHLAEIAAGSNRRLYGFPLQTGLTRSPRRNSIGLPVCKNIGRMAHEREFLLGRAGFPHRHTGYAVAGVRRIFVY